MDAAALRQRYGEVHPLAQDKVLRRLDHHARAFIHSRLWDPAARVERSRLPTLGRIIAEPINGVDAAEADCDIDADDRAGLY